MIPYLRLYRHWKIWQTIPIWISKDNDICIVCEKRMTQYVGWKWGGVNPFSPLPNSFYLELWIYMNRKVIARFTNCSQPFMTFPGGRVGDLGSGSYIYDVRKLRVMKIVSLYPYDDVYQVVSTDESTVYFQSTKEECKKYLASRKRVRIFAM